MYTIITIINYLRYWVRVAAFNEVPTDSPAFTTLIKVTTLEGVPQTEPVFLNVSASTSTSCLLYWKAPDSRTINGRPKGSYNNIL